MLRTVWQRQKQCNMNTPKAALRPVRVFQCTMNCKRLTSVPRSHDWDIWQIFSLANTCNVVRTLHVNIGHLSVSHRPSMKVTQINEWSVSLSHPDLLLFSRPLILDKHTSDECGYPIVRCVDWLNIWIMETHSKRPGNRLANEHEFKPVMETVR